MHNVKYIYPYEWFCLLYLNHYELYMQKKCLNKNFFFLYFLFIDIDFINKGEIVNLISKAKTPLGWLWVEVETRVLATS